MVLGIGLSPTPPRAQAPITIRQDRPAYLITEEKGFYGPNDHLYKSGEMIYWLGEPSLGMEPLNDLAVKAMKKYLTKLDDAGRKMAEKLGKHYSSLEDAFDNAFSNAREAEDISLVSSVVNRAPTPLLGVSKKVQGIGSVIEETAAPLLGGSRIPRVVGGQFENDRSRMNTSVSGDAPNGMDASKFI